MSSFQEKKQRFQQTFEKLTQLDQIVLTVVSLFYVPATKSAVAECLRQADVRHEGKYLNGNSVLPIFDALEDRGFMKEDEIQCPEEIEELVILCAMPMKWFPLLLKAVRQKMTGKYQYKFTYEEGVSMVRLALYAQEPSETAQKMSLVNLSHPKEYSENPPFLMIFNGAGSSEWLPYFSTRMQTTILRWLIDEAFFSLAPIDDLLAQLEQSVSKIDYSMQPVLLWNGLFAYGLRGEHEKGEALLNAAWKKNPKAAAFPEPLDWVQWRGWHALLTNQLEAALHHFQEALLLIKKETRKKKIALPYPIALFHCIALIKTNDSKNFAMAERFLNILISEEFIDTPDCMGLKALVLAKLNRPTESDEILADTLLAWPRDPLGVLFSCWVRFWLQPDTAKLRLSLLEEYYQKALQNGYRWLAMEYAELIAHLKPKHSNAKNDAKRLQNELGMTSLINTVQQEAEWERLLNALLHVGKGSAAPQSGEERLVWFVSLGTSRAYFSPRVQKLTKSGKWSKGRPLALKHLINPPSQNCFTSQDLRMGQAVRMHYDYYGGNHYELDHEKALLAAIGHPLLFLEDSGTVPVELVRGEPELWVEETRSQFKIRFSVELSNTNFAIVKETPTRYKVIEITETHRTIANTLKNRTLAVPSEAKDLLSRVVGHLAQVTTVHSPLLGEAEDVEQIQGDTKPCLHLLPFGEGFKVEAFVKPFQASDSLYFKPGKGMTNVIAEINGKRVQAIRNLKEERAAARKIIHECPALALMSVASWEWHVADPESCLQILLELQAVKDQITLEWPEGEKLKIAHHANLDNFSVQVNRDNNWFSLTGELQLAESQVLSLQQLLDFMDQSSGRFVPLGDGQFLALTEAFRQKLESIKALTEASEGGVRFPEQAAWTFQDLLEDVETKASRAWKNHIQHLDSVRNLKPELPSTLQAELRDYQLDGFCWLSRLAAWGMGACLADDMGLGKTIQALAILLARASEGPALVVAPTSVCFNWQDEANRFAPTLNVTLFGGKKREALLNQLQAFDLLVCSYGLLQQESELLTQVQWHTVVLDEAQAIKNRETQRSKAAMKLLGNFKMITTGTPIENHLGELWNLMRFLNPGLLGSLEKFNQRFATPIERHEDARTRQHLKDYIQPFILRRNKTQVLQELPPRTEIVLHVELSSDEAAFYEALRRKALETLRGSEEEGGGKHIKILAEIMRLRRACCHSKLVMKNSAIPSSKLTLFGEVVEELLENRHKALVFSQFVDHLSIIKDYLDEQGHSYLYLDGSTPAKRRKTLINEFQAGGADLFLISLKAGGMGLNLTAADYVIHMDPWWNPAVEDQASDRAHRIGQKRPVTIYRLVSKNTIEEKIVALHHHKRDLANSLLEGSDLTGKLSADELLRLIREH